MLGWSINLFKVFGIQLAVHASFLLLLAYYAHEGWLKGGVPGIGWNVLLIVLFFVCVILHELGHSLTARSYGVRVPRILLLPIGGMAEMDHIPKKSSVELWITAAGPAVNFVIAATLVPVVWQSYFSGAPIYEYSLLGLAYQLLVANLVMGVFNLLPAFPMDGGRILRALLAYKLPYLRATYWAVMIGRVVAVLAAAYAIYEANYLLAALFAFIFFAGKVEYQLTLRRDQEERYWAEMARRVAEARSNDAPPPLIAGPY